MKFFKSIFFTNRFFYVGFLVAFLYVLSFFMSLFSIVAEVFLFLLIVSVILDFFLIYLPKISILVERNYPERFSNGDQNKMNLNIQNNGQFSYYIRVIEEFPFQFQLRDEQFKAYYKSAQKRLIEFEVKPTERGAYKFGKTNIFISFFGFI